MKYVAYLVALGLLALIGVPAARAEVITFTLTGTVDGVDSPLSGTFSVGQAFSSTYTFDSTTPPRLGGDFNFSVFDALLALSLSIGGYSASSTAALEIQVDNDPGLPFHDRYAVVSRPSDGLTGPPVAGIPLTGFIIRLDDSTDTVFSDARILPTSLSLSSFDSKRFFLGFADDTTDSLVTGTLDSISVSSVPEPSSVALTVVGLASLSMARRLRRRFATPRAVLP